MSTRKNANLHGLMAAVPTPFTADGSAVDEAAVGTQVERWVAAGLHGIVPTGTTGEFTNLTTDEYRQIVKAYVDAAAGRLKVIIGVGSVSTPGALEQAKFAEEAGADAIMVVPPFYDPLSFDELKAFLADVAAAVDLQIVYYNVPGATGLRLETSQLAELGSIDGVDYLKDTSGDMVGQVELLTVHADKITAFNGWDTLTFCSMASGAKGAVWGVASIVPEKAVELWNTIAVAKDLDKARELWGPLWKLCDFLEAGNYVAGIKAALEIIGQPVGQPRKPILPVDDARRAELTEILKELGAA
ncbi:dihydrodipicolinate synthase family protein [Brooklawnia sp.]|uniref:dihydrodipicolinate synthase family protein n=1 Tax=Brooklawnia sp. TaxID=2699740 RepID=UPI00311F6305